MGDSKAELRREATRALFSLKVPNAKEWADGAEGDTVEEIIKDALRRREAQKDDKQRLVLDDPVVQIAEVKTEQPPPLVLSPMLPTDKHAVLRRTVELMAQFSQKMKEEGIAKITKLNADGSETVLIAGQVARPRGRPEKV